MSSFKCHIKVYTIILRKGENLMRTLAYRVEGQRLEPIGDHSGIKAGSKGYLRARFEFNEDWDGCIKVASFYYGGIEYACMLDKDDSCDIPEEVLVGSSYSVSVEGRKDDYRIPSRTITERQLGGAR